MYHHPYTSEAFENTAFRQRTKTVETEIDPDGHDWDNGKITKPAACEEAGEKTYTCRNDKRHTKTEEIEAPGHDWGNWKVTAEADETSAGERIRVCKNDPSHVEKETIPALGISGTLLATFAAESDRELELTWTKVYGAAGYDVFFGKCSAKKYKNVKTVKTRALRRYTVKKLSPGKSYKAYVKAYILKGGKKQYVRTSPSVHVFTSGGTKKYTNPKGISLKPKTAKLKTGGTLIIGAKVSKLSKKKKLATHVALLRYKSSDKKVAAVNAKGTIRAVGKGTCSIYVYTTNGFFKTVKVTVEQIR